MKFLKGFFKWFAIILASLIILMYVFDVDYLLRAVRTIYFKGYTTAFLVDYKDFPNREIKKGIAQPWPISKDYNSVPVTATLEKTHKELKGRIDLSLIRLDKQQVYYQKRKDKISEDMRKFHNWVKSNLIYTTMNGRMYDDYIKYKILDIGVGVGGDIGKFYYCVPEILVGIDPDLTNLTVGGDCAVARYNNYKRGKMDFPPMYFTRAKSLV